MVDPVETLMRQRFFEGMRSEDVQGFVNTLAKIQQEIPGGGQDVPSPEEIQAFISGHDTTGGPENTGDGKMGAAELVAALGISSEDAELFVRTFNQPERGADQALDAVELREAAEQLHVEPTAGGGKPGGSEQAGGGGQAGGGEKAGGGEEAGGGGGSASAGGGLDALLSVLLQVYDEDGDGKLDESELDNLYERFDRNGNGTLELSEFSDGIKADAAAKGVSAPSDAEIEEMFTSLTGGGASLAKSDFAGGVNNGLEGGSE